MIYRKRKIVIVLSTFARLWLVILAAGIINSVSGNPAIQDTQDPTRGQPRTLITRPSKSDPFEILDINRAAGIINSVSGNPAIQGTQPRTLITRPSKSDPFEILDINRDGMEIKPYIPFEGGGDWLLKLRFKIKNRSENPIVAARIGLAFPEAIRDKSDSLMMYVIDFGRDPNSHTVSDREPISIVQNDVLTFELTEQYLTHLNQFLATRGFSSEQMTKVDLFIMEVDFANGLAWIGGSMMEPSKTNPGHFTRVRP